MMPERVAIIRDLLVESYDIGEKLALKIAWDIYNELNYFEFIAG